MHLQVHYFTFDLGLSLRTNTKCCPVSSKSYDLYTCKVWSCYVQWFRRKCIYKKYFIWPLSKVKVTWSIALNIIWPLYLQSLKLLRPMVKEMNYQENTLFDLDPKVKGSRSHKKLSSTLDIMWPMHQQSLMLLHPMVKKEMHLQENTLFDLDLGVKVTRYVAQYLWHHVSYEPAKFDIAISHD